MNVRLGGIEGERYSSLRHNGTVAEKYDIIVLYVGYKNSEDRISEMDKLECYRLGWVGLV